MSWSSALVNLATAMAPSPPDPAPDGRLRVVEGRRRDDAFNRVPTRPGFSGIVLTRFTRLECRRSRAVMRLPFRLFNRKPN